MSGVASLSLTALSQTWGQMAVFTVHRCLYQKPMCPGVAEGAQSCPLSTHPSSWMLRKVSLVGDTLEGLPPGSGSDSGMWSGDFQLSRSISHCFNACLSLYFTAGHYTPSFSVFIYFFLPISLALL